MNTLTAQSRWKPAIIWLTVLIVAVFPWTAGPVSPAHADPATVLEFTQSSPGCAGTPSGLVSLWRGEGSGADTQAANNAITRGGVTYVAGRYGSAFNFDGVDDDLLVPASASLQLESAFTVEFWFSFPHDVVPGTPGFFQGTHFLNKGWTDFLSIANNMGNLELGTEHPRLLSTTTSWSANIWYHAAITYDAGQYHMYVDGDLEHSLFRPDPLLGDLEDMFFSHSLATPFNPPMWWKHRLDEIAIYDRALTAAEVAGRAGICPPTDSTPPTITITSPGATSYLLNQQVPAEYACTDAESGVASCTGPVPSGLPIDTSTVGPHSFTVTAADNAGNTAAQTAEYTVAYKICLLYNPAKVAKKGSTIPIKIQLCDSGDINMSSSSIALTAQGITQTSTATSGPVEDAGNANPDNNFRHDPTLGTGGGYIYNLSTQPLAKGSYTLDFTVGADTAVYHLPFQVQ